MKKQDAEKVFHYLKSIFSNYKLPLTTNLDCFSRTTDIYFLCIMFQPEYPSLFFCFSYDAPKKPNGNLILSLCLTDNPQTSIKKYVQEHFYSLPVRYL